MNRLVTLIILLASVLPMSAQTYEKVVRDNLWNDGCNVAGVRQDSVSAAVAELSGGYEAGGFHRYGGAESVWSVGADTRAVRHLKRLSLTGRFGFKATTGYGMYGSMFIDPGFYPVDILEFTPGQKNLQEYSLHGGISYDLTSQWRIGAGAGFLAANLSKRKDLRHTNFRLDIEVAPSVMWHEGDWAAGLSLLFGKNSETVDAEVVGVSGPTYYAFFDKGLMYGLYEGWEGSGIHLNTSGVNGFPVRELFVGASAQMSWKGLYVDILYKYRKGKAGEKDYLWYEFPGHELGLKLGYRLEDGKDRHYLRAQFTYLNQVNHESILEQVTEGGVSTVVKYASNRIFERRMFTIRPEYEYVAPRWEIRWNATADIFSGLSSQKYPYVDVQNISSLATSVDALVHLWKFDLSAGLGFEKGFFNESGKSLVEGAGASRPDRYEDYTLYRIEYVKAPRLNASLALRFNFWKGLYVQADGGMVYAFGLERIKSPYRAGGNISIGYNF